MQIDGKPVRDARKSVILHVNTRDIKAGKTKDPGGCAAAKALCRQEHIKSARVHLKNVYLDRGDYWERYMTPASLRLDLVGFDRGGRFPPGRHKIYRPWPSMQLGAKTRQGPDDRRNHVSKGRRKIAKVFHHKTADVRHHLAK